MLLKVSQGGEVPGSCRVLSVDSRRRCVTLYDPATPTTSLPPTALTPTKIIQTGVIPHNGDIVTNALSSTAVPSPSENEPANSGAASSAAVPKESVENASTKTSAILGNGDATAKPCLSITDILADASPSSPAACATFQSESQVTFDTSGEPADRPGTGSKEVSVTGDITTKVNGFHEAAASSLNNGDGTPVVSRPPTEVNLCSATIKGVSAPKMFTFDGIFTHDDSQVTI